MSGAQQQGRKKRRRSKIKRDRRIEEDDGSADGIYTNDDSPMLPVGSIGASNTILNVNPQLQLLNTNLVYQDSDEDGSHDIEEAIAIGKEDADSSSKSRRRDLALVVCLIVLAVIAVILGALLGGKNRSFARSVFNENDGSNEDGAKVGSDSAPTGGNVFDETPNSSYLVCDGATILEKGVAVSGSTMGVTSEEARSGIIPVCNEAIGTDGVGVWYSLTGDGYVWTVDTFENTYFDTQISVYEGQCNDLICSATNDQFCGDQSRVSWYAKKGVEYFVLVHGYRELQGDFLLNVQRDEGENSECIAAQMIDALGAVVFGSTNGLAREIGIACSTFGSAVGEWHSAMRSIARWYTVVGTGRTMTVSTCGGNTNYRADISVVTDTSCNELICVSDQVQEECPDEHGSILIFPSVNGELYYVFILGEEGDETANGEFDLTVSDTDVGSEVVAVSSVEQCKLGRELVADGTSELGVLSQVISTKNIFAISSLEVTCGDSTYYDSNPAAWYTVIGTGKSMTASTCNDFTKFDTQLTIFTGTCEDRICVDGNDQFCGDQSSVTWKTERGVVYYILVHGFGDRVGVFGLDLTS
jgi:hypothetical protein